jgi:hypothetical protein
MAGRHARLPIRGAMVVLLCAVPALEQPAFAQAVQEVQPGRRPDEPELVLLEVRLDDNRLADAIPSYQSGRETYLPLGELARLLTLAIRTQPVQGRAEGFILAEERSFHLDAARAVVTLSGRIESYDRPLVRVLTDDIYVAGSLLSRWLPLDLDIDLSSLTLRVRPRETLPLQARLQRERLGPRTGARGYEDPGYPVHPLPYRLLGVPFIDQTLSLGLKTGQGRQRSANYTAYLTGDLGATEASVYVSSTREDPSPDVRFTLARHDPDAGLLGVMRARSVMFGSGVSSPSVVNIAARSPIGKGVGWLLSSRPLNQPTAFDRHTLQGDLPPGWDVELYYNDALVGFQAFRPDGRYSFDDQPLSYGVNDFRLVFHGPLGQQRVERQSFVLEQSAIPAGEFYYTLAQHRDSRGEIRAVSDFEWGLNKSLAATASLVRLPALVGAPPGSAGGTYGRVGMRLFGPPFIATTDFHSSPGGGWLNESGLKTRLGSFALSYTHIQANDRFASEVFLPSSDPLRTRDTFRVDGSIPTGLVPRLPVTLELLREQFASGTRTLGAAARVSAYYRGTSVSNQLTWQSFQGRAVASGSLQVSRRVGAMGLGALAAYTLKPDSKFDSVVLTADWRLSSGYLVNLGVVRSMANRETLVNAGLNKDFGSYGLGLTASRSSRGGVAVGLQLFVAMGRDPRTGKWWFDALPKADGGAASVRVFVDNNGDGVMDSADEPVENASIMLNGARAPVRTDAAGLAFLGRIPVHQHVDVALDAQSLEDPMWQPQTPGLRIVPRPGTVAQLEFPVVATTEVEGNVWLQQGAAKRGIANVVIEVMDLQRQVVASTRSSTDGYFVVTGVRRGSYLVRISPEQLAPLGIIEPGMRSITVKPDGALVSGVDFLLQKADAAPEGKP